MMDLKVIPLKTPFMTKTADGRPAWVAFYLPGYDRGRGAWCGIDADANASYWRLDGTTERHGMNLDDVPVPPQP